MAGAVVLAGDDISPTDDAPTNPMPKEDRRADVSHQPVIVEVSKASESGIVSTQTGKPRISSKRIRVSNIPLAQNGRHPVRHLKAHN